jgi:molybdopterin-biosynthesis enzyme MoeA-like protein
MVAQVLRAGNGAHQPSYDAFMARMRRFGRPITQNNLKQAYFPKGAVIMENLRGTGPRLHIVESGEKAVCRASRPASGTDRHVRPPARPVPGTALRLSIKSGS